jgi:hypothetical protein
MIFLRFPFHKALFYKEKGENTSFNTGLKSCRIEPYSFSFLKRKRKEIFRGEEQKG